MWRGRRGFYSRGPPPAPPNCSLRAAVRARPSPPPSGRRGLTPRTRPPSRAGAGSVPRPEWWETSPRPAPPARVHHRAGAAEEGERRRHDLVAGTEIEGAQREDQRVGSRGAGHRVRGGAVAGDLLLQPRDLGAADEADAVEDAVNRLIH